jgi:hypothetical protein
MGMLVEDAHSTECFISKPLALTDLCSTVRDVLDSAVPSERVA